MIVEDPAEIAKVEQARAILGGDEEAFLRAEAAERSAAGMPPYGRLAGVILSSADLAQAFHFGTELKRRDAPLRRVAYPSNIASVLLFLTSELASYVTGQVISVDGGVGAKFPFPMDDL